jgi:hypothetical protein
VEVFSQGNTVTVALRNAPLLEVLQRLSELTGVRFSWHGALEEETLSMAFRNLPVEQAIKRLLHGWNFATIFSSPGPHSGPGTSVPRLVAVQMFPRSKSLSPTLPDSSEEHDSSEETVSQPTTTEPAFLQTLQQAGGDDTSKQSEALNAFLEALFQAQQQQTEHQPTPADSAQAVEAFYKALQQLPRQGPQQ